ncbi:hypothetical protein FRC12_006441 [Ceratobasidium sp. 428]|nr:hypothetical protein FRC12_006441 [Ceratobasidium sp. 428]
MHFSYVLTPLLLAGATMALPAQTLACSQTQLVFLAGTYQSGLGDVGSALRDDLQSIMSGITAYGIPYDTSAEYDQTLTQGAAMTVKYLQDQADRCPNQQFVLGGYSKGAMVVHRVDLGPPLKDKILAVTVFGDPNRGNGLGWPIKSPNVDMDPRAGSSPGQNVASFCNNGDLYCYPGGSSVPAHLAYASNGSTKDAAKFIKQRA